MAGTRMGGGYYIQMASASKDPRFWSGAGPELQQEREETATI